MERILAFIAENRFSAALAAVGLGLVLLGGGKILRESQGSELEIIEPSRELPQTTNLPKAVIIDVGGAVASPSVYRLDSGARIADALAAAGGLTAEAESGWVAQNLNQAEMIKDGMKIYIPFQNETGKIQGKNTNNQTNTININIATEAELDALWGIGAARVATIINNRPYQSLEELTTKAGIPAAVLEKNAGKITY